VHFRQGCFGAISSIEAPGDKLLFEERSFVFVVNAVGLTAILGGGLRNSLSFRAGGEKHSEGGISGLEISVMLLVEGTLSRPSKETTFP
jgi:hypothetical protein